jgi:hypothetical protein
MLSRSPEARARRRALRRSLARAGVLLAALVLIVPLALGGLLPADKAPEPQDAPPAKVSRGAPTVPTKAGTPGSSATAPRPPTPAPTLPRNASTPATPTSARILRAVEDHAGLLLAISAVLVFVALATLRSIDQENVPPKSELDERDPRARARLALLILALLVAASALWWRRHGNDLMAPVWDKANLAYLYWTLLATPAEKRLWEAGLACALIALLLAGKLAHRLVWRSFFPDFVRIEPDVHRGGRPEPLGRLYSKKRFENPDGTTGVRHYYKHGNRTFPIFRFDYVDLPSAAKPILFGIEAARCGRLERDPEGNRFKRIAANARLGAHAPLDSFRSREVTEDHNRKTSIVVPGATMNPEVMRRKIMNDFLVTPYIADREHEIFRPESQEAPPEGES